jgi:purine-binding chemotaxis protein CheW
MPQRTLHDPTKNLVGFIVGDVEYAVAIGSVREIANPALVVSVPRPPVGISGVADYRNEVVPVIDLRARFGLPTVVTTRRTKWILVDVGEQPAALVVDAVTDVFGGTGIKPAPALGEAQRGITGVTKHAGGLVFVLDVRSFRDLTAPLAEIGAIGPSAKLDAGLYEGPPPEKGGS